MTCGPLWPCFASYSSLCCLRPSVKQVEGFRSLDVLVCNAGINTSAIAPHGPCPAVTEDGFNSVFQVNYLGHFALTRLLVPALRASVQPGGARVVNVASVMHRCGRIERGDETQFRRAAMNGVYSSSKLAQVLMTYYWQEVLNRESAANQVELVRTRARRRERVAVPLKPIVPPAADSGSGAAAPDNAVITVHCCNPGAVASEIWRHDKYVRMYVCMS